MAWSTNTPRSAIVVFCGGDTVHFDEERGVERLQVVATQMPATPDPIRFYSALLFERGATHNPKLGLAGMERLPRDLLRRIEPRMLIVDEVHHLLSGSYREQGASLNLLKYLANDLRMSLVLVGTADALIALQGDAQMVIRFAPLELPRWGENDAFHSGIRTLDSSPRAVEAGAERRSPSSCSASATE